jgi:hypothetical protein
MPVTGNSRANATFTQVNAAGFYANQGITAALRVESDYTNGTNADQCDVVGVAVLTVTASNAQTVDITADLKDFTNTAINPAEVVDLTVKVVCTNSAATLDVKQGASNGWVTLIDAGSNSGLRLRASTNNNDSGVKLIAPNNPGVPVNSTCKTLLFTPSAHAMTVTILAAGRSA